MNVERKDYPTAKACSIVILCRVLIWLGCAPWPLLRLCRNLNRNLVAGFKIHEQMLFGKILVPRQCWTGVESVRSVGAKLCVVFW